MAATGLQANVEVVPEGPRVVLTWNDGVAPNVAGARIEKKILSSGEPFALLIVTAPNVTTYTDTDVEFGGMYVYRVRLDDDPEFVTPSFGSVSGAWVFLDESGGARARAFGIKFYGDFDPDAGAGTVLRDNYLENNGLGHVDFTFHTCPNITIDNPASETLYIRRGVEITP